MRPLSGDLGHRRSFRYIESLSVLSHHPNTLHDVCTSRVELSIVISELGHGHMVGMNAAIRIALEYRNVCGHNLA